MKRLCVTLVFFLWVAVVLAGDVAEFRPIGFSESGQYYACAQIGVQDGSGFPYADLWVIDVLKNEQVATVGVQLTEEKDGTLGTPEQALKQAIGAAKLERFSIQKQENPGTDLLVHVPTDHSGIASPVFSLEARVEGGASGVSPKFGVLIETTKTEPALQDMPTDFGPAQLLKLSLMSLEEPRTRLVLQEDKRLPKSRAYPLSYTVRRVTAFREGLVVIVSYTTPGFEGPNVRYIAVSGKFVPAQG